MEEVFDEDAAGAMGIGREGTVCVMIHSGSRGLGHQVGNGTGPSDYEGMPAGWQELSVRCRW